MILIQKKEQISKILYQSMKTTFGRTENRREKEKEKRKPYKLQGARGATCEFNAGPSFGIIVRSGRKSLF